MYLTSGKWGAVLNVGSVFSGDGLLDFGLTLAGWEHAFLCESEPERREILSLRWPGVPIYRDVREVDGSAPRPALLAGGFPCKGASSAGLRTGLNHPETALWREMARAIGVLRPRFVLLENVRDLLSVRAGGAWAEVVGDLAALGYVCAWDCLPAAAFGAAHLRDRVFCVAADASQLDQRVASDEADAESEGGNAWPIAGGRDRIAATNPASGPAGRNGTNGSGRLAAELDGNLAPDPSLGRRGTGEQDLRRGQSDADRLTPPNSREGRQSSSPPVDGAESAEPASHANGPGVHGPWRDYEPAIRRWEALQGPAPEPLLRGVDARSARKVVRSRLSALGDGVQVQAGHFLGDKLMELALELETASPPSQETVKDHPA